MKDLGIMFDSILFFLGAFRLYDVDNDGFITRDEMYNIVDAIYQMVVSHLFFFALPRIFMKVSDYLWETYYVGSSMCGEFLSLRYCFLGVSKIPYDIFCFYLIKVFYYNIRKKCTPFYIWFYVSIINKSRVLFNTYLVF